MARILGILFVLTVGFGVARFVVPVSGVINHADIFKDLAHLFVGLLFGVAIAMTVIRKDQFPWLAWGMAIGLTVLEVVAFLVRVKS